MATVVPFTTSQLERDLLISAYLPLLWLALAQVQQIDTGRPHKVALRWLTDMATAVGPLLSDCDDEAVRLARLSTEDAVAQMRQMFVPGRAS